MTDYVLDATDYVFDAEGFPVGRRVEDVLDEAIGNVRRLESALSAAHEREARLRDEVSALRREISHVYEAALAADFYARRDEPSSGDNEPVEIESRPSGKQILSIRITNAEMDGLEAASSRVGKTLFGYIGDLLHDASASPAETVGERDGGTHETACDGPAARWSAGQSYDRREPHPRLREG